MQKYERVDSRVTLITRMVVLMMDGKRRMSIELKNLPLFLFMPFKEKVRAALLAALSENIQRLRQNLSDLRASAANETKSTAGDKYETALAMLQTEQDHINKQLQDLLRRRATAETLPASTGNMIGSGSLAETDSAIFYISVAAGKMIIDGKTIFTISASSPLGQKLCGLKKGEIAEMNGVRYMIKQIH